MLQFKQKPHPKIASVFAFPNGNVAVCDHKGEQMPEFQRDIFLSSIKLSKYDLIAGNVDVNSKDDLFWEMWQRAKEMREIGFNFDWADEL